MSCRFDFSGLFDFAFVLNLSLCVTGSYIAGFESDLQFCSLLFSWWILDLDFRGLLLYFLRCGFSDLFVGLTLTDWFSGFGS